MSSSEKLFGSRARARLAGLSDDEFRKRLEDRCPELLEDPGEPPSDAFFPEVSADESVMSVVRELTALEGAARRVVDALSSMEGRRLGRRMQTMPTSVREAEGWPAE